jgi:hypothetical protein
MTYTDVIDAVYRDLVFSTLTIAEIEEEMVKAAVRAGASPSYAKRIVCEYLDS